MNTQLHSPAAGAQLDRPAAGPILLASRLATAHLAIALVALLVLTGSVDLWPAIQAGGRPLEVDAAAHRAAWAALAYLIVTALAELRSGWQLDHGLRTGSAAPLRLAAHLLVLVAAAVTIVRGFHSLALLAGLYIIVPGLATVSFLTLAAGLIERRTLPVSAAIATRLDGSAGSGARGFWLIAQWIAALALVGTLFYLEEQPLPHGDPDVLVESSVGAGAA